MEGYEVKKNSIIKLSLLVYFIFTFCEPVIAWDDKITHKDLSKYAADLSILRLCNNAQDQNCNYLKNVGLNMGLLEILEWNGNSRIKKGKVEDWLREGAQLEDTSSFGFPLLGTTRSFNHFHNPLKPWDQAGLDDWVGPLHYTGQSSLLWAQDGTYQQNFPDKDSSWQKVREYYYLALTSLTDSMRQENFAKTFRGLGHQMHLLQDTAVPDHVRNDAHPEDAIFGKLNTNIYFESWAKAKYDIINSIAANIDPALSFPIVNFDISYGGLVPITQLFDAEEYNGTNPSVSLTQGLSEYTNANFFSGDTIFAAERYSADHRHYFPYPKKSSTDLQSYLAGTKPEEAVVAEDGDTDTGIWISKTSDGENVQHFVRTGKLTKWYYNIFGEGELFYKTFYRDEKCHEDYAKLLIPRAVGYSAGLLDYFFRGKLQVTAVPIFYKNSILYLRVKIKNMTPNETMTDGTFTLTYSYRPTGGNPDGSEDIWGQSSVVPSGTLLYDGEEKLIDFPLPTPIPRENYDSAKFTLAFKGTLGNEVGAVIGKSLTLGEIKFEEEWNNGLNGNHNWAHTGFNLLGQNIDNGTTSNLLEGDSLVKDNIRFLGHRTARVNDSFVSSIYNNGQFRDILPIKITPNTYIVFKIDEMWINERTPAPPGYTNDWQFLWLGFNNGVGIQYSTEGQGVYFGPNVAYFEFNPNLIIVDNIYDLFKVWDITIPPGDLYLNEIGFVQQLYFLDELSTAEHHQHMRIDGIWIIEGRQQ